MPRGLARLVAFSTAVRRPVVLPKRTDVALIVSTPRVASPLRLTLVGLGLLAVDGGCFFSCWPGVLLRESP